MSKLFISVFLLIILTFNFIFFYSTGQAKESTIITEDNEDAFVIKIIHGNKEDDSENEVINDKKDKSRKVNGPLNYLVLVNKEHGLPADFIPPDLVIPDVPFIFIEDLPKKKLRREAAEALEDLFAQAQEDDIDLVGVSAYRSYSRQSALFNYYKRTKGRRLASKYSAHPGHSEHQTGLAIDVTGSNLGYNLLEIAEEFAKSKVGRWLTENSFKYGFIIRYPAGKEEITGYKYEPWHLRYVGVEDAVKIVEEGLTLEEYLLKYKLISN